MALAKNIRYLRKKMGYSQEDFADKFGYKSYTTIQKWESGISKPPFKQLKALSDLFNIDIDTLVNQDLQYAETANETQPKNKGVKIPVLGEVAAGIPIDAIEDIIGYEEITAEMAKKGEFFGLQIKGNSMEPKISNGDIVIVKKQSDVENGAIAVVLINGDSTTVKRIKYLENGIMLIPSNPQFEPMFYDKQQIKNLPIQIIGRVIELRARF